MSGLSRKRTHFICITWGMSFFVAMFGSIYEGNKLVDVDTCSGLDYYANQLDALPEAVAWAQDEDLYLLLCGRKIDVTGKTVDQVLDEATRPEDGGK